MRALEASCIWLRLYDLRGWEGQRMPPGCAAGTERRAETDFGHSPFFFSCKYTTKGGKIFVKNSS